MLSFFIRNLRGQFYIDTGNCLTLLLWVSEQLQVE